MHRELLEWQRLMVALWTPLLILFALSVSTQQAVAQTDGGALSALRDHVAIRQSLKDKNTINESAFATITVPDEGDTLNLVAAAVSVFLISEPKNPKFNVAGAVQFNQNSAPDKRQNVFVGGLDVEGRRGGDSVGSVFPRFKGNAGYKRNGEKHTSGFTANGYVTVEKNRPEDQDSSALPIGSVQLEFTPQVGFELDDVLNATKVEDEGAVWRFVSAVKVNVYPLRGAPRNRFVLSAELAFRRDVRTDFVGDRNHSFAQFSAAVGLDPYKIFSIAVDRVVGDDPSQDFSGPDFTRFALKVQLTKPQKRSIYRAMQLRTHII